MILDAGFLIGIDRGDERAHSFLAAAHSQGSALSTTHPVLAQVWRDVGRQVRLAAALRWIDVHPFDDGRVVGRLLAASGTSDVVDAHLAVMAAELGEGILTGDVDDLARLCGALGPGAPRVYRWPPE